MSMQSRVARTPLALAVLNLLNERAMHPYEMQQAIRERGLDLVLKLRSGSLYHTVERLEQAGLIRCRETSREGRRPERTVYEVSELGRDEFLAWLRELLSEPAPEYPPFASALAFLAHVRPDEAVRLLRHRALMLEADIASAELKMHGLQRQGLPRLFMLEAEYLLDVRQAELDWVRALIGAITERRLDGLERWESFYASTVKTDPRENGDAGAADED